MALRVITAEVNGQVKRITAEVPDGATDEDIVRAVQDSLGSEERTLAGQAKEFGKGMAAAIPEGGIQMLRGLSGIPEQALDIVRFVGPMGSGVNLLSRLAKQTYQPAREGYEGSAYQQGTAASPGYEDSLGRMGGQVIGSALPLLAASALGGPVPAAALAVAQGAGSQGENIDQLRAQGAQISPTQEGLATALGGAIGATEMIPLARLSGPLGRVVQRGLGNVVAKQTGRTAEEAAQRGISAFLGSIAAQAAEEGAQEGGSQFLNNLTEQQVYNAKRGLTDNVMQSAIAGAFGGAALDATIGRLARKIEARQLEKGKEPTKWREQAEVPEAQSQRVVDEPSPLPYPVKENARKGPDALGESVQLQGQSTGAQQTQPSAAQDSPDPSTLATLAQSQPQSTAESETGANDPAYADAVRLVLETGDASPSNLQQRLYLEPERSVAILAAMQQSGDAPGVLPSTTPAPLQTNVQSGALAEPSVVAPVGAGPLSSTTPEAVAVQGVLAPREAVSQSDTGAPQEPEVAPAGPQSGPAKALTSPVAPQAPSQLQDTEQWKAQAAPIARNLRGFANKVGAKDTYLRVIDRIHDRVSGKPVDEALGSYDRGLIQVAYQGSEAPHELAGTVGHEVTHAFKEMGLYTEPELKVLEKQARKDGTLDAVKADEFYGTLTPEKQVEESIAQQFGRFVANEFNPQGQQRGLFSRAKNFLDRLHSGFRGQGFLTAEDVFQRFNAGEIGNRNRVGGIELQTGVPINGNVASVNAEPSRPEQGQAVQASEDVAEDLPEALISPEAYEAASSQPQGESALSESQSPAPLAVAPIRSGDTTPKTLDGTVQSHGGDFRSPGTAQGNLRTSDVADVARAQRPISGQFFAVPSRASLLGEGTSQPQSTPEAHQKLLSVTDYSSGQGRRKTIAEMRKESGLSPEEFDNAFRELVKQDRIQSSKGGMSVENMLRDGYIEEGNYVRAADGRPYITASMSEPTAMYSRGLSERANPEARRLAAARPLYGERSARKSSARKLLDIVTKTDERKMAITAARQATFDQRARVADSDRLTAKSDRDLYADHSAHAMALMADRSSNVAAAALTNGGLIYSKGRFTVTDTDKSGRRVEGLMQILQPLMKNGNLDDWFYYQAAKRGEVLDAKGLENRMSPEEIKSYLQLGEDIPELKVASEKYKTWNDTFVDALADSGRISKATAEDWKSRPYLPFYRMHEDLTSGPGTRHSLGGSKTLHKIKGGDADLADGLENVVRNMMSLTDIAMKNVASQRAMRNAIELGWARPAQPSDKNAVTVYKDGKAARFAVDDQLMFEAMTATDFPLGWAIEKLRIPAQWLRSLVTKSPVFMAKNLVRDSADIFFKGGFDLIPFASTVDGAMQAYSESPHYKALENAGIVGGALLEGGAQETASRVSRKMREGAGETGNPLMRFWDKWEEWADKSEAANRVKVYENALKQHGNEAQALFEALEVMNFSRRGNSHVMRTLTALVPFLNARLQGLDLLGRHLAGHAYGMDAAQGGRGDKVRKQLLMRGLFMGAATALYVLAISGNKAWQNATPQERDDNWFLPIGDDDGEVVRVPIPFELGFIFKTTPERLWSLAFGKDRPDQTINAVKRGVINNLAQPVIPQAVKPLLENYANYSFFRDSQIENTGQQQILPEERWDEYTSQAARRIGKQTGFSPLKVDNLLRGYFGTVGQIFLNLTDAALRPESQGPKADYALWNYPVVGSLLQRPDGAGKIIDFYEFHTQVDQAARTLKQIQQYGDPEKLQKFVKDHQKELAIQPAMDKLAARMSAITKMERMIQNSPQMTGEVKRKRLDELRKYKSEIAAQGVSLKGRQ